MEFGFTLRSKGCGQVYVDYDIFSMAETKAGFGFELLAAEAVSLLGGFEMS